MSKNTAFLAVNYAGDVVPIILMGVGLYLVVWHKTMPMRPALNWTNLDNWWQRQQHRFNSWSQAAGKNLSMPCLLLISTGCALGCSLALTIIVKLGVAAVLEGLLVAFTPCLSLNVKHSRIQSV